MRGFYGESINPIDDKNRVTLPTKFRKGFPEASLVVVKGDTQGQSMLRIYDRADYLTYIQNAFDRVGGFDETDPDHVEIRRDLLVAQEELKYDEHTYRITLAAATREHAQICSDVHFVGVDDCVEMWDAERYVAYTSSRKPRSVFDLKKKSGGDQEAQ